MPRTQPNPIAAGSEFARRMNEARDVLLRMSIQDRTIQDSIRDSHEAIGQSRRLLMQTG